MAGRCVKLNPAGLLLALGVVGLGDANTAGAQLESVATCSVVGDVADVIGGADAICISAAGQVLAIAAGTRLEFAPDQFAATVSVNLIREGANGTATATVGCGSVTDSVVDGDFATQAFVCDALTFTLTASCNGVLGLC